MNSESSFDVLAVAGILPLDLTFVLPQQVPFNAASSELRTLALEEALRPRVTFHYQSFQRSGGGTVANVVAYLGSAGEKVAICGIVGDDDVGTVIKKDLRSYRVNIDHVRVARSRNSRVAFILHREGSEQSRQIHRKPSPVAVYNSNILQGLPRCKFLILGRANKSVVHLGCAVKDTTDTRVVFHMRDCPWRSAERGECTRLMAIADVLVLSRSDLGTVRQCFGLQPVGDHADLLQKTSAELILVYGGMNDAFAIQRATREVIQPEHCQGITVREPTGMKDCFLGAFLSFLFRVSGRLDDSRFVKAALGYANQIAAMSGTGIGARSFPSPSSQVMLRNHFLKQLKRFTYDVAISFAGENRTVAEEIADKLTAAGVRVFYDRYVQFELWGNDLYTHLSDIYENRAHYCLMIISKEYAANQWTNLERQAAQARAFVEHQGYILPLRLDDTVIPGLLSTIGYVDLRRSSAEEVVRLLRQKLGHQDLL